MANPHRERGTRKGTSNAWRNAEGAAFGIESLSANNLGSKPISESSCKNKSFKNPVKAGELHSGPFSNPDDSTSGHSPEKSPEERLAEIEQKINSEKFSDDERKYISETCVEDYLRYFNEAKKNREGKGGKVDDKSADEIREKFIGVRKKWINDRGFESAKRELLKKYLDLKLPHGLLSEKSPESGELKVEDENIKKIKQSVENEYEILKSDFEQILERCSLNEKHLREHDIADIKLEFEKNKEEIIKEVTDSVFYNLAEKFRPINVDTIQNLVFIEIRDRVYKLGQKYLESKESTEKNKFTPEQLEKISLMEKVAKAYYSKQLEESKDWEGFQAEERKNMVDIMMKGALRILYNKKLIPLGAPDDNEIITKYISEMMNKIISK